MKSRLLYIYILIILLLAGGVFAYKSSHNEPQVISPPPKEEPQSTFDQSFGFECPSDFKTYKEYLGSIGQWVIRYTEKYPRASTEEMMAVRDTLRERNNCGIPPINTSTSEQSKSNLPQKYYFSDSSAAKSGSCPGMGTSLQGKYDSVIRYGVIKFSSTSGDIRLNYYDIKQGKVLESFQEHPWFWAGIDDIDHDQCMEEFAQFVESNRNSIFKIEGKKEGDDCVYYTNGPCLENITIKKATAIGEYTER